MAINSFDVPCDELTLKSQGSSNYFNPRNVAVSQPCKPNFGTDLAQDNIVKKRKLKKNFVHKSPYISGDNIQLLSQVTEKRFVSKIDTNIVSSFPLAAKLYKANSDEFNALKRNKKVKKSVLTLPNKPTPVRQLTTVSDMNDSEYYFSRDEKIRKKNKKRIPTVRNCRGKGCEYYDRDALYCSQMDINLDCSSSDTLKRYDGHRNRKSNLTHESDIHMEGNVNPHDVWAVLRNINRFQFKQSPQISEDSFITHKKKKNSKRRNRKDMRVFETRTEEFAYISSIEVDNKSSAFSQSSSFDNITVIDKTDGFNKLRKAFESDKYKNKEGKCLRVCHKNGKRNEKHSVKLNNVTPITNECKTTSGDYVVPNRERRQVTANDRINNYDDQYKYNIEDDVSKTKINSKSQASQCTEMIHFNKSDQGEVGLDNITINDKNKDEMKLGEVHLAETESQINGITKVVVNKNGYPVEPNMLQSAVRKHRQTHTIADHTVIAPKFTQTEIKRRLSKQKYPIVILGKDQLSSSFEVVQQEHTQFDGLNEKVWPFMLRWYGMDNSDKGSKIRNRQKLFIDNEQNKILHHEVTSTNFNRSKQSLVKCNKKPLDNIKPTKTKQNLIKKTPIIPSQNILNPLHTQNKHKPIQQFRERMLKLWYKNSSVPSVIDECRIPTKKVIENNTTNIDVCSATHTHPNAKSNTKITVASPLKSRVENQPSLCAKRTWAKAKWASDFVENIIRKIKTGAYYTQDSIVFDTKSESREIEVQTASISNMHVEKSIHALTIPGFDTVLPAVEIKTMNVNEISVKHCISNILVHFDVSVSSDPAITIENSPSLTPINVTESHTKVFKCRNSILNAVLPAELCTILPKMLRSILASGEKLGVTETPVVTGTIPHLSAISKVTPYESSVSVEEPCRHSVIYHLPISEELWRLLKGRFINSENKFPKLHIIGKKSLLLKYERHLMEHLMPSLAKDRLLNDEVSPLIPMMFRSQNKKASPAIASENINTCQALIPYPASDKTMVIPTKAFKFSRLSDTICFVNTNASLCLDSIKSTAVNNYITINLISRQCLNGHDMLSLSVGSFIIDYPLNDITTSFISKNENSRFINADLKLVQPSASVSGDCADLDRCLTRNSGKNYIQKYVSVNNKRIHKRSFLRLYKKCKSTTNIVGEKTTSLSSITELDDFFQALGTGKLVSSIFDSQSGKKIISLIREMENWATEINSRQALLILLLANKKDTSSLVRYRPLILQGIAVKRITKANELDMEIEVIERENLHTFSRYEGISYLPASIENQDNLFEELCWIAKNTASDYQRPFDESSEKLLKSLLEKRKKLNPSYLRVMARYVGLGLLKSPGKK